MISKIVLLCILSASFLQGSCWTSLEVADIEGFTEQDNIMMLSFKDAQTCDPIVNAELNIENKYKIITDENGYAKTPAEYWSNKVDTKIPLRVIAKNYEQFDEKLSVIMGVLKTKRFLMTKTVPPTDWRFVLSWEQKPSDLDLHLVGPDYHISFRDRRSVDGQAYLDRDAMNGYGAETITLIRPAQKDEFKLSVVNFSNESPISGVNIQVYGNGKLVKSIQLPLIKNQSVDIGTLKNGQFHALVP